MKEIITPTGSDMVNAYMNELEARARGERKGIPTGFNKLDEIINGLLPGSLTVISGRAKMGKTQFAMNIVDNIVSAGKRVYIASMEMKSWELMDILFSKYLRVNSKVLKCQTHDLTDVEWKRIADEAARLSAGNLIINDNGVRSVEQLETELDKYSPDVLLIDNLNLMRTGVEGGRYEKVTEISGEVKAMAMQRNLPVMLVAHINRMCDARIGEDRRPRLSDLRDSGSIEQDANVVIFLFREGFYTSAIDPTKCLVDVAANRTGETRTVMMTADLATGTFTEN